MILATIDPLTLPSLSLANRSALPSCPAVYFALEGDRVSYIGRTTNLQQRWMAHHRYSQLSIEARIAWLECSDPELLPEIEEALIAHFNPPLNGSAVIGGQHRKLDLIAVYVSKEKKQALEAWAEAEERSVSWIVSKLIDRALQEREAENGSGSTSTTSSATLATAAGKTDGD